MNALATSDVATSDVATLAEFFAAVFPDLSSSSIELRALPSCAQTLFTEPDMLADMQEHFLTPHRSENVYFGVATRVTLGGSAKDCGVFNALFVDFDYKDTREPTVRERLAACPLAPSIIVASGGGEHVYWLLTEPVAAKDGAVWLRRLAATLGADPAATDAARILRVPGTINWKYTLPRKAKITSFQPTRRYALADFASWLVDDPTARQTAGSRNVTAATGNVIGDGSRNVTLTRLAGAMRRQGFGEDAMRAALLIHNAANCTPPLDEDEVAAVAHSVARYEPSAVPTNLTKITADASRAALRFIRLKDVPMQPVPWLWPGYLARGAVHLLVGDPDQGKTLAALDIAARITTGTAFPDGVPNTGGPGNVVVLTAEDSHSYTIRPRVEAAEGDSDRVHVLSAESAAQGVSLQRDLEQLDAALATTGAKLVIIDPLSAYLPGIDTYRDNEVRATLAPFVALAERRGLTVIGIIHMSKNTERNAMQRVLGSTAFTALSRATFMVARDPEDSDRRLFLPVKFNLAKRPAGLAFRPAGAEVRTPEGRTIKTVRAVWDSTPVTAQADEVLRQLTRGSSPSKEAEAKLRAALANGPILSKDAEEIAGLPETTLRRVRERIGAETMRDPADPLTGPYYWLPPDWSQPDRKAWMAAGRELRVTAYLAERRGGRIDEQAAS